MRSSVSTVAGDPLTRRKTYLHQPETVLFNLKPKPGAPGWEEYQTSFGRGGFGLPTFGFRLWLMNEKEQRRYVSRNVDLF